MKLKRIKEFKNTYNILNSYIKKTPLEYNTRLSKVYNSNIYFKREDQQLTRSFKIRGALNKILKLNDFEKEKGVVCGSAGNHAQGVAYTSNLLNINSTIFLPKHTPIQKVEKIKSINQNSKIKYIDGNFDNCLKKAKLYSNENNKIFIHPFDDEDIIIGNGTVAMEIFNDINPDIIITPIGGGGLISGILLYSKLNKYECQIIGVEGETCPSMKLSLSKKKRINYLINNNFIDGATINKVGNKNFNICMNYLDEIQIASLNKICKNIIDIHNNEGIILEPAGALSISILENIKYKIKNKNVVCILSGGNNGFNRYEEILNYSNNNFSVIE